jgi:rhamnose utilization protein RhaD (predicted bifunctional aldolase and dehydrogenase)/NAD(P)-dependent dehydrogenase (short-subunit alcohol dehydrogenase family)
MKSLWSDADAADYVARYAARGVAEDLALRVYTSRLLGAEPRLVQHGGGNTSLKTTVRDVFGEMVEVLAVKGSGWDLGDIEPEGLPAVRMAPLVALRRLGVLSDEAMVDAQRGALIDSTAPNPSVETLLHAWIPHRYVDHTHANAVLALVDQSDGLERCRALFGDRLAIAPYCMPGFSLAQLAAEVFEGAPHSEGMVLLKHGVFTWGDTARDAYERMIAFVSMAEDALAKGRRKVSPPAAPAGPLATAAEVAPILRGVLAEALGGGRFRRVVLEHRASEAAIAFGAGAELSRYGRAGLVTPDHVIRIKPWPLLLPPARAGALDEFAKAARAAVAAYAEDYRAYFERHNALAQPKKTMLDPWPRWIVAPGLGLYAAGGSAREARVASDVAETTASTILDAEALGRFESISEAETFAMEYWSLEQAKLGKAKARPLAGQVAVVTGGAGVIGAAIAAAFAAEGAEVAVLDADEAGARATAARLKGLGLACDVTDPAQVRAALDQVVAAYGGLDILVSNAGAAFTGRMGEVDDAVLRRSFELNFFAHQSLAQAAVKVLRAQGTGGALLFNVSKQALNPGPDFGPYGLPKAATLALMRQYAVEYGADGIRANAVNADRIRSGLLTDDMIESRAAARGLSEADYMSGNLLGREVTAQDVAQAFVALALADKTTAAVLTVDGGNIAAAVR